MSVKPSAKVLVLPRRARHPRRGSWGGAVDRLDARVAELERRIADFDRRYARLNVGSRLGAAGTISLLVHAVVIFGLTFTVPQLQELQDKAPPLTVVLVNAKSQTRPQNADALGAGGACGRCGCFDYCCMALSRCPNAGSSGQWRLDVSHRESVR